MLEQLWIVTEHSNVTLSEVKAMPIQIRLWWIDKITQKISMMNKASQDSINTTNKKTTQENSSKSLDISKVDKFFKKFEK